MRDRRGVPEASPMDALVTVSRAIRSEDDVAGATRRTLRAIARALSADCAIAWEGGRGERPLTPAASCGVTRALSTVDLTIPATLFSTVGALRPLFADASSKVARECPALGRIPHRTFFLQPIDVEGQLGGVLGFFWTHARYKPVPSDRRLIAAAARQLALVIENAALAARIRDVRSASEQSACEGARALQQAYDDLRLSREELRALSAHVDRVRERERARIAREIHDELGQALTGLKMDLVRLSKRADGSASDVDLDQLPAAVDGMMTTVRRIASELRPSLLDDLGLVAALEWQAQDFVRRTGVKCRFRCRGTPDRLDEPRAMALFRIFQEVLTNVARHAQASQVQIVLNIGPSSARLEVSDNGRGISEDSPSDEMRLGLLGMQERAAACGGRVVIGRATPNGTIVRVRIPMPAAPTPVSTV